MPGPACERRNATTATTARTMTPAIAHHHVLMKPEMLSNIRVGSGSFALSDAKNVGNLGSTKVARTMTVTTAMTATTRRVDERRRDRRPGLDVGFQVRRQAPGAPCRAFRSAPPIRGRPRSTGGTLRGGTAAAAAKVSPAWSSPTMSRRTFLRSLSVVSSAINSRASMIGMPASTNTLSWREKCMISLRATVFFVISNLRMLLCSLTSIGSQPALNEHEVRRTH